MCPDFHLWTFLTKIKQVLNSQPNYWHQGLFKNCNLKENMHSVIVIKSQTIIKMMVFEKQYHSLCQSSSSPIALFLLKGDDRPPCPYCFLASAELPWVLRPYGPLRSDQLPEFTYGNEMSHKNDNIIWTTFNPQIKRYIEIWHIMC